MRWSGLEAVAERAGAMAVRGSDPQAQCRRARANDAAPKGIYHSEICRPSFGITVGYRAGINPGQLLTKASPRAAQIVSANGTCHDELRRDGCVCRAPPHVTLACQRPR